LEGNKVTLKQQFFAPWKNMGELRAAENGRRNANIPCRGLKPVLSSFAAD